MSQYAVTCQRCLQCVWHGDDLFTDDGQELLTAYADSTCQQPDCPNTTTALDTAAATDPIAMIRQLQARIAALETRPDSPSPAPPR